MVAPLLLVFLAVDRWSEGGGRQPRLRRWVPIALLVLPVLLFRPGLLEVAGGRPVLIAGAKSSLCYFLAGLPCAVPFTDLSSQCFTRESSQELGDRFLQARPDFVFAPEDAPNLPPPPGTCYRCPGKAYRFLVCQNEDRPPVPLPGAADRGRLHIPDPLR